MICRRLGVLASLLDAVAPVVGVAVVVPFRSVNVHTTGEDNDLRSRLGPCTIKGYDLLARRLACFTMLDNVK